MECRLKLKSVEFHSPLRVPTAQSRMPSPISQLVAGPDTDLELDERTGLIWAKVGGILVGVSPSQWKVLVSDEKKAK
jgi:hypothetical protein